MSSCKHKNKENHIKDHSSLPIEFHQKVIEIRSFGALKSFIQSELEKTPTVNVTINQYCVDCKEKTASETISK